jgi:hypothetical protein
MHDEELLVEKSGLDSFLADAGRSGAREPPLSFIDLTIPDAIYMSAKSRATVQFTRRV